MCSPPFDRSPSRCSHRWFEPIFLVTQCKVFSAILTEKMAWYKKLLWKPTRNYANNKKWDNSSIIASGKLSGDYAINLNWLIGLRASFCKYRESTTGNASAVRRLESGDSFKIFNFFIFCPNKVFSESLKIAILASRRHWKLTKMMHFRFARAGKRDNI